VPNRIVFSAHLTNLAERNRPGPDLAAYYEERARGRAGLIVTEEQSVHPTALASGIRTTARSPYSRKQTLPMSITHLAWPGTLSRWRRGRRPATQAPW
jgi:2,4-dienoyl-CoA reductase-like NADH-dependent reductase (Old Yellow Enzyme family)